jgi:hypothetical protein
MLGMVVHTYNSSTQEAEVGESQDQPGCRSDNLSTRNKEGGPSARYLGLGEGEVIFEGINVALNSSQE